MSLAKHPQCKDATMWGESTTALSHAAPHPVPASWGDNPGHLLMATWLSVSLLHAFYKALAQAMSSHPRLLTSVLTSRFWIGSCSSQSCVPACAGTKQLSSRALPVLQSEFHINAQVTWVRWATASCSKPFSEHPFPTSTIAAFFGVNLCGGGCQDRNTNAAFDSCQHNTKQPKYQLHAAFSSRHQSF